MSTLAPGFLFQVRALQRRLLDQASASTRFWITHEAMHLASLSSPVLWKFELERAVSRKLAGRFRHSSPGEAVARSTLEFLLLAEIEDNRDSTEVAFKNADQRTSQLINILATLLKTLDQERGIMNNALH